uniref:Unclassified n=3 Tax=Fusarium sambucinum species complex TaxID=569360 RepID=W1IBS5_FUSPS|nr:unclassified [Fusarium pseudograminearum CS3427]CDL73309.1 unclassified [Fusarium pseudograminearum CS5834]CDL73504.1 unclassified [Fusarium culmorum CS7071]CDX48247.1 unclassified [Fusarium pseudograminearum CS5834]CDX48434.1 unclassified [Fusarium pseudograminearum CS3427]
MSEWTSGYKKPSNCGKTLKQFQPSRHGNIVCGTGNDSWYGKIEIDYLMSDKWVIRSQAPITVFTVRCAVHRLNVGWRKLKI